MTTYTHDYRPDENGVMRHPAICCGEKPPGRGGEALVLACQLCPKSPTYWRNTTTEKKENA